jgi:hypothetical protein
VAGDVEVLILPFTPLGKKPPLVALAVPPKTIFSTFVQA